MKPLNDDRALGILYHNLGMEEARQSHWDRAAAHFQDALDSHRRIGNEEGLALTYSQLGKTFLEAGHLSQAEKCLNNASEHFIKLGQAAGEAAVLRLLAGLYVRMQNPVAALRCLERVVSLDLHQRLPELDQDRARLAELRQQNSRP
ncbi:MAG: tetratricopeptide repeat protein [Nitrospira sp.]